MPVAMISTSTSPAFGPSRSSSTISRGCLAAKATAARVFISGSLLVDSCNYHAAPHGVFAAPIPAPPLARVLGRHFGVRIAHRQHEQQCCTDHGAEAHDQR